MSNSPTSTAAWWSLLVRHRCRFINPLFNLCIKLLNARYKEISS